MSVYKKNIVVSITKDGSFDVVTNGIKKKLDTITDATTKADKKLSTYQKSWNKMKGVAGNAKSALSNLKTGLTNLDMGEFIKNVIHGQYELERLGVQYNTVFSSGGSQEQIDYIRQFADMFKMTEQQTKLSMYAITQLLSKGIVISEEFKRQLGDQVPGAIQIGATAMNTSISDFLKNMEQGVIEAEEFWVNFAKSIQDKYEAALDEASQSVIAIRDRINDAIETYMPVYSGEGTEMPGELSMFTFLDQYLQSMATKFQQYKDSIQDLFTQIADIANQGMQEFENAIVKGVMTSKFQFKEMVNSILADMIRLKIQRSITDPLLGALKGILGLSSGGVVPDGERYNTGGYIGVAAGSARSDSQIIAVSGGEYIINAMQTAKHLPLLNAINSGVKGFAQGGFVAGNANANPNAVGGRTVNITVKDATGGAVQVKQGQATQDTDGNFNIEMILEPLERMMAGNINRNESPVLDAIATKGNFGTDGGAY